MEAENIKLVTYTALAFTVQKQNEQVQALRKAYDPAFQRWQPHINFCFPFVDRPHFNAVFDILQEKLKHIPPFEIVFRQMDFFAHNGTVFLTPETKDNRLDEIYNIIVTNIPELKEKRQFIPHTTVGKFKKGETQKRKEELQSNWKEWIVSCDGLNIIERDRDTPFKTYRKIEFRG